MTKPLFITLFLCCTYIAYPQLIPITQISYCRNNLAIDSVLRKYKFTFYKIEKDTSFFNRGQRIKKYSKKESTYHAINFDSIEVIKKTIYYKKFGGDSIIVLYTENITNLEPEAKYMPSAQVIMKNSKIYSKLKIQLQDEGYKVLSAKKSSIYKIIRFKKTENVQILITGIKSSKYSDYVYQFATPYRSD